MAFAQKPVTGPFTGIIDNLPRPYKPDGAWDDILNMFAREGRLISRPRLNPSTSPPDGAILRNMIPFLDILGNLHNLALTTKAAWMVTSPTTPPGKGLTSIGPVWNGPLLIPNWDATVTYAANDAVSANGVYFALQSSTNQAPAASPTFWSPILGNVVNTALPWGYAITNGRVYFSNGSYFGLYSDGESTIKSCRHPGAWRYAMVLANHLVTANTTEPPPQVQGSSRFPQRVRWSSSGDPNTWTTGPGFTAGSADLLEVPDRITGLSSNGRSGFVYRTNGITLMSPTGIGTQPFQFDQITNSPKGVGNFYDYSLDTYGGISVFVSEEDIYLYDGSTFTPIGGTSKNSLFSDLDNAGPSQVFGTVHARFDATFPFLSYWLSLPKATWIYSWNDQAWTRFSAADGAQLTALARMVL